MKSKISFALLLSLLIVLSCFSIVDAQKYSQTVVSTELINWTGMTTAEMTTFIEKCADQGMTMLTVRVNTYDQWSTSISANVAKVKEFIQIANAHGIQVNVDFHTWYTTWDYYFRDSASNAVSNRQKLRTHVVNTITAFADTNVYAYMVMNEPAARAASSTENQFILDLIADAKAVTSRPVSVRFMCGYSPSTGHYSTQIDTASDYLCRNTYWDPRSPTVAVYETTEAKVNTAISTAHSQGKGIWFTEFGKSNSNQETQRAYVAGFVSWGKGAGVDGLFCWVSQPEGSGESYNIWNGYTPLPAFYELTGSGPVASPSPTVAPSPTATEEPTPTPFTGGGGGGFPTFPPTIPPTPTITPSFTPTPTPFWSLSDFNVVNTNTFVGLLPFITILGVFGVPLMILKYHKPKRRRRRRR